MITLQPPSLQSSVSKQVKRAAPIRCSSHGPWFETCDGIPFFYLADTAWEMLHRLTINEATRYLQTRALQGFTVIQTVVLAEFDGVRTPNANGDLPLHDLDPQFPNDAYFDHVDAILALAENLDLQVALLPSWGDKWFRRDGDGPEIFNPDNAWRFGHFLGTRYRNRSVIWVMGGDRPVETQTQRSILEAMADGIRKGSENSQIIGFHPPGGKTSIDFFPSAEWVDFHMTQTGHVLGSQDNYTIITKMRAEAPDRPCFDSEPLYEDHPIMLPPWIASKDYWGDYEARRAAWWALLSGAAGHVYGCHAVWQFFDKGRVACNGARRPWDEALRLPGAEQMLHLKNFVAVFDYLPWTPLSGMGAGSPMEPLSHIPVARATRQDVLAAYLPKGGDLALRSLPFLIEVAHVLDPASGKWDHWPVEPFSDGVLVRLPPDKDWVVTLPSAN